MTGNACDLRVHSSAMTYLKRCPAQLCRIPAHQQIGHSGIRRNDHLYRLLLLQLFGKPLRSLFNEVQDFFLHIRCFPRIPYRLYPGEYIGTVADLWIHTRKTVHYFTVCIIAVGHECYIIAKHGGLR